MASFSGMLRLCRRCRTLLAPVTNSLIPHRQRKHVTTYLASAAALFAHSQAKQKSDLQVSDSSNKLRREVLLKAATDQNADAVSLLLDQTKQALLHAEHKYIKTVKTLMGLLEHHLTVLGNQELEDEVWDVILQGRHQVEIWSTKIKELQLLFSFVQKLTNASVEMADLTGSATSSRSLQEQLTSAQEELESAREQHEQVERQLQELQAHCIQVIAEHAQREERKKKEQKER